MMDVSHVVLVVCVVAFTSIGAVYDLRTRRLPNLLTLSALIGALIYAMADGAVQAGWSGVGVGLLSALGGFAVGFGTLFVPWLVGGGGGGDVKFAAAVGAWLGASQTFQMLFVAAVFVLIGALGILGWQFFNRGIRRMQEQYLASTEPSRRRVRRHDSEAEARAAQERAVSRRLMPFGVPIAVATWCVLLFGEFLQKS